MSAKSVIILLRSLIFLLSILVTSSSIAQVNPSTSVVIPPSPNAASLGVYGQVPVSFFTGLPEISIPIGTVSNKDVSVDINLNYHGGGIRPEHHPGWVGLGWDLNAGGVITRKVNITADERCTFGISGIPPYTGYYYNYKRADTSVWASPAVLSNKYYAPDSAGIFTYKEPPAPDEFNFNFGKYSGTFYYNHKGKWQVKSKDPINLKIEEVVNDNFSLPHQNVSGRLFNLNIGHIFYQFTITTPDGNKYIFGGTNESVEFTRNAQFDPVMSTYIKHDDGIFSIPSLGPFSDGFNNNVMPTAWYLTKIITKNGEEIKLVYERGDIIATQSLVFQNINFKLVYNSTINYNNAQMSQGYSYLTNIINPCYLVQIITPNQTVKFSRSNTNELSYNYQTEYFNPAAKYEDLCNQNGAALGVDVLNNVHWKKLDSISFYSNKTGLLNKFTFQYKNNPTSRLMLNSVQESGNNGSAKPPYLFSYDTTALPSYNARKLDHWGFYNKRSYFDSIVKTIYDTTDIPGFIATKTSNFTYAKAGSLISIKYPTRGTTSFVYESNDYSKVARRFPFTVTDTTDNVLCGGLRIKKIIIQDSVGNLQNIKEYSYVLNYNSGGSKSSGILSGVPRYFVKNFWTSSPGVNEYYYYWYDIPVEPMGFSDGSHVTYTEVVEKWLDGSYTVYNYSNSDQVQYRDTAPVEALAAFGLWYLGPNNNLGLERGKLLLKRDYKSGGMLLQKAKYEYNETTARNIEPVRIVDIMYQNLGIGGAIVWHRETAYQIYTYPQFLIKKTDSLWDQNGNNPQMICNNYSYNSLNLLSQVTSINSKRDTLKTFYQYPPDMIPANDPTGVYQEMADKNIISDAVVQKQLKDSTQLSLLYVNYYKPYSNIYARQNIQVQNRYDPLETRVQFYQYDSIGNILEQSKLNDLRHSYIWNYNKSYPVAEIKNASTSDVAYTSFEADGKGNWNNFTGTISVGTGLTQPPTGDKYYNLTTSSTLSKTVTSGKVYTISYWSKKGSYNITGGTGTVTSGRSFKNWTYYEHKITATSTTLTISGTGEIDEVRLYPSDARMTTYTYNPLIGMTSQCDANNWITYYEYDNFNRLSLTRDQDWNILKKICYNYAGQPIDCGILRTYYNIADSATFYKDCGGGFSGSPRTYVVHDSVYTSMISQEDANQKAKDDIIANGPAYANANPNATCPETTIFYTNSLFKTTSLKLTNKNTGLIYTFTLGSRKTTSTVAGTVPKGYYRVVLHTNGSTNYYSVNTYVQSAPDTDFDVSNVDLTSINSITTITIY